MWVISCLRYTATYRRHDYIRIGKRHIRVFFISRIRPEQMMHKKVFVFVAHFYLIESITVVATYHPLSNCYCTHRHAMKYEIPHILDKNWCEFYHYIKFLYVIKVQTIIQLLQKYYYHVQWSPNSLSFTWNSCLFRLKLRTDARVHLHKPRVMC